MPGYQKLALITTVATYALIVVGGIVRVTGSGLGCPDWPTCHGQIIPPLETAALIEFTHRLVGALVSPLILATTVFAWLRRRDKRSVIVPATALPLLLVVQILLGAVVVWLELPGMVVLVHLGFALLILGGLTWISTQAGTAQPTDGGAGTRRLFRLALGGAIGVFVLILVGALVRAQGASWACVGFPTCNGAWLPFGSNRFVDLHLTHRLLAYLVTIHLIVIGIRGIRLEGVERGARLLALALPILAIIQVIIGAVAVSTGVGPHAQAMHLAVASAIWVTAVALLGRTYRPTPSTAAAAVRPPVASPEAAPTPSGAGGTVRAYISLTKPRVMSLLLITTLAAMMIAGGGLPSLALVFWTLLGGALASGGASAINCYFDRDIDQLMERTTDRAIPSGKVKPEHALIFGIVLGVLSFVILTVFANLLAASLALGALLFYVFVYTRWLKRSTPHNIVIGGAAGAVPPLVGYAAVAGHIDLLAIYLFAIIFFWTPPHFWALALLMEREYAKVGVPMLPIVRGGAETRWQIVLYTIQLVALTVIVAAAQLLGLVYLAAAVALGGLLLYYAVRLQRDATSDAARRMFKFSMLYLTLLFTAMVIDRQVIL